MPDPTDISAELPAPRENEPEALRSDIVDELSDHLKCASQREIHSQDISDPRTVEQRVLARFGNPAQIARRLWWDAMQERIMSQRITAIAAGVAAAACLVACGLVWRMMEQSRTQMATLMDGQQAASSELATKLSEMITAQQQTNAAMIAAIGDISIEDSADSKDGTAWHPLKIRFVDESGSPQRLSVTIRRTRGGGDGLEELRQDGVTGTDGIVEFGHLPPGIYTASYTLPSLSASSQSEFLLGPGRTDEFEVVCPSQIPEPCQLTFDIAPPESLADIPLYYLADIHERPWKVNNQIWTLPGDEVPVLLLDSSGNILGQTEYSRISEIVGHRGVAPGSPASNPFAAPGSKPFGARQPVRRASGNTPDLGTDAPLSPFNGFPPKEFSIVLLPMIADPETTASAEGSRPPLNALDSQPLVLPRRLPTAGELHRITIDTSHDEFWEQVTSYLSQIDPYSKMLSDPGNDSEGS